MPRHTTMARISVEQQRLLALWLDEAATALERLEQIEDGVGELLGVREDGDGFRPYVGDAVWNAVPAERLLEQLGIAVEPHRAA